MLTKASNLKTGIPLAVDKGNSLDTETFIL